MQDLVGRYCIFQRAVSNRRFSNYGNFIPFIRYRVGSRLGRINDDLDDVYSPYVDVRFNVRYQGILRIERGIFVGLLCHETKRVIIFDSNFNDGARQGEFYVKVREVQDQVRVVRVMMYRDPSGLDFLRVTIVVLANGFPNAFGELGRDVCFVGNRVDMYPDINVLNVHGTCVRIMNVRRDRRIIQSVGGVVSPIIGRRVKLASRRKLDPHILSYDVRTIRDYLSSNEAYRGVILICVW